MAKRFHPPLGSALLALFFFFTVPAFADTFRVTKVYDGDTVKAEAGHIVVYIMLVGIDAPELASRSDETGQPFGEEAKEFLSNLVVGRDVEVEGYGRAPYPDDNLIGVIHFKGENVNLEMVRRGLAEACPENLPPGFDIGPYLEAERQAKAQKAGIWSQGKEYVSPKAWRAMHRLKPSQGE